MINGLDNVCDGHLHMPCCQRVWNIRKNSSRSVTQTNRKSIFFCLIVICPKISGNEKFRAILFFSCVAPSLWSFEWKPFFFVVAASTICKMAGSGWSTRDTCRADKERGSKHDAPQWGGSRWISNFRLDRYIHKHTRLVRRGRIFGRSQIIHKIARPQGSCGPKHFRRGRCYYAKGTYAASKFCIIQCAWGFVAGRTTTVRPFDRSAVRPFDRLTTHDNSLCVVDVA